MPADRPNIIVISTDQQRYDSLGVHGNERVPTPNLQDLADRGVLFTHAYIQNTVCVPSRACLHTGRHPHQHGADSMSEAAMPALPDWEITFMERLQAAGYETGAVGKIHMIKPKGYHWTRLTEGKSARWRNKVEPDIGPAGIGEVYEKWLEERSPGAFEKIFEQRREEDYVTYRKAITNVLPADLYIESWITENAKEFIRKERDTPFFLWVGYCGPHTPYDPPEPYAGMYNADDVPLPKHFGTVPEGRPPYFVPGKPMERSPDNDAIARRVVAHYWALNRMIDDKIGEVLEELRAQGQLDNTLIMYTSDHGDMLLDWDGMWGKGNFYETIVRVPLIVSPPSGVPVAQHRFDGLVETFDVAATALDFAGVAIPRNMEAASLRPVIETGKGGEDSILCEYVSNDRRLRGKCVRTERFKYAFWGVGNVNEFYNLAEDPDETRNLIDDPSYRDEIVRHQELLLSRLSYAEKQYRLERKGLEEGRPMGLNDTLGNG